MKFYVRAYPDPSSNERHYYSELSLGYSNFKRKSIIITLTPGLSQLSIVRMIKNYITSLTKVSHGF